MSPYICTATATSGAVVMQVIFSERRGAKTMEHIGSAHTSEDLAGLKAKAQSLIHGEQLSLDLGVDITPAGTESTDAPVPTIGERAGYLIDAFVDAYRLLRLDVATCHDQVFQHLVMARIETGLGRKHSLNSALCQLRHDQTPLAQLYHHRPLGPDCPDVCGTCQHRARNPGPI